MSSEVKELDQLILVNALLPQSLGLLLKHQKISHTCLHVRSSDSLLAVGSNVGHFWIIDMQTRKLIKELSDGKSPLKILRFHSEYSLIATATEDGMVTVINFIKPSMKQLMMEREQKSVTAIEWAQEKDRLFVGYNSGKVLSFAVQFDKVTLTVDSTALCDYGSEIVQLSQNENLLLVSTLAKPVLLDMKTGQSTQVGSKGKKAGHFGGTFVKGSAIVARPGLRLWIANDSGEVLSTAKFKDVFNSPLPPMTLFGNIATTTTPSDAGQFGKLIPWSDGCIVCYHGNTVWVLDPFTLVVKGVMTLGQRIIDAVATGKDLYLLLIGHQRPIVKLSLPAPVIKTLPVSMEGDERKEEGVIEEEARGDGEKVKAEGEVSGEREKISKEEDKNQRVNEETKIDTKEDVIMKNDTDQVIEGPLATETSEENLGLKEQTVPLESSGDPSVTQTDDKEEGRGGEEQQASRRVLGVVVGSGLKGIFAQPLNKLTEIKKELVEGQEEERDEPLPSVPLSTPEAVRRAKMLQVQEPDEDTIAVRKKSRRVKKKTTKRKHLHLQHTPLSSAHSSMDNLDQLDDDDARDTSPVMPVSPLIPQRPVERLEPERDEGSTSCPSLISTERDQRVNENDLVESKRERGEEQDVHVHDLKSSKMVGDNLEGKTNKSVNTELKWEEPTQAPNITIVKTDFDEETQVKNEELLIEGIKEIEIQDSNREEEEKEVMEEKELEASANDHSFVLLEPSPSKPDSLIATPPKGIRKRARAFNIDSDDPLFGPTTAEEVLFWEESSSISNPVIPTSPTSKEQGFPSLPNIKVTEPASVADLNAPLWASHSSSLEDTPFHPLGDSEDHDDVEADAINKTFRSEDSMVADDYLALINQLAGESRLASSAPSHSPLHPRVRADAICPPSPQANRISIASTDDISEVHSADIWCPVPQPSNQSIQCLAISCTSIWLIDNRRTVYWSNPATGGRDWQSMNKSMSHISTSASGKIVWGVHHQTAYARHGISDLCSSGSEWKKINFRKKSMASKSIKVVACDNTTVWAIMTDGKILNRKGVCDSQPEGTVWAEIPQSPPLVHIACCNNIVWGLDQLGVAYVREGISPSSPFGRRWKSLRSDHFHNIAILDSGVVWGITTKDKLLFRCGASAHEPEGGGPWWQVAVSTINKVPTASEQPVWKVMSFERSSSILHSVTSLLNHPVSPAVLTSVAASSHSGVCLLTSNSQLHACWGHASGYHYETACEDKMFDLTIWTKVTSSNVGTWVVREDGELYCIVSSDRFERVECQGVIEVLTSSPAAVWVLTKGMIWSRQGITDATPQGFSWELIQLGSQMEDFIIHLSMGSNVAWAVDKSGKVYFRFGIHPREPGTGMSPAWVEVQDPLTEYNFINVSVNSKDWLVWALDCEKVPYIRKGVTSDYPVGKAWERVSGETLKRIAVSDDRVFGLTLSGDLLLRQGINEENPAGIYWTKLPGNFEEISCNPKGELWTIDVRGSLKKQRGKVVSVSSETKKREKAELEEGVVVGECGDWEFL